MTGKIQLGAAILFGALMMQACSRPVARFDTEAAPELKAPAVVSFTADMTTLDSVRWDFGDGQISREPSPEHTFWMSGRYKVTMTGWKGKKHAKHHTEIIVGAPDQCLIRIRTPMGDMVATLSDLTPGHRDNFIKLTESGFYDSLLFHRVINGFMIQGGDPGSRQASSGKPLGSGGPGYQIPAEFTDKLVHVRGALAAARMGDQVNPEKRSSGSQFYIVQGSSVSAEALEGYERQKGISYTPEQKKAYIENGGTPFLDAEYTVFGQVIMGLDVIDRIAATATDRANRPVDNVPMVIQLIR